MEHEGATYRLDRDVVVHANLTTREKHVLTHILRGDANKDIANALGLSVRTVEFHVGNILHKVRVDSRARLISVVGLQRLWPQPSVQVPPRAVNIVSISAGSSGSHARKVARRIPASDLELCCTVREAISTTDP
jgi:DNA-binding CsgD family transcriptional regulator